MRAVVLKSHEYPTAPVAYVVSQVVSGVTVFGSICLDFEVGGLNVKAVEASDRVHPHDQYTGVVPDLSHLMPKTEQLRARQSDDRGAK